MFDCRWFEGEPGYSWPSQCVGVELEPGDEFRGRIEIVDEDTAERRVRKKPGPACGEDLQSLRCIPLGDRG